MDYSDLSPEEMAEYFDLRTKEDVALNELWFAGKLFSGDEHESSKEYEMKLYDAYRVRVKTHIDRINFERKHKIGQRYTI